MLDIIEIEDSSMIVAKVELTMEVRVLGNGVTAQSSNGSRQFIPVEVLISFNGTSPSTTSNPQTA